MWLGLIALTNITIIGSFIFLWPTQPMLLVLLESILCVLLVWLFHKESTTRRLIIKKLEAGFASLKDGDFAISLPLDNHKEHHNLVAEFNEVVEQLRIEKQSLYQRELLLDRMVNASNVVSLLLNHRLQIVYCNRAGRLFFSDSKDIIGQDWQVFTANDYAAISQLHDNQTAIIKLPDHQNLEQDWLLSTHQFKLHGATHKLVLLKPITSQLQAQETLVWKKVIRVINHELNNSIAPISSMCHSGNMLAEKIQNPQLNTVFNTISGRIAKLANFIESYSRLARISQPKLQPFNLVTSLKEIQKLYAFQLDTQDNVLEISADPTQLEQVIINTIKNAHEAKRPSQEQNEVHVILRQSDTEVTLAIEDNGQGMMESELQQAFLPSFSTKENGSGLGLSICKEIIENHGGQITIANRQAGGLRVEIKLNRQNK